MKISKRALRKMIREYGTSAERTMMRGRYPSIKKNYNAMSDAGKSLAQRAKRIFAKDYPDVKVSINSKEGWITVNDKKAVNMSSASSRSLQMEDIIDQMKKAYLGHPVQEGSKVKITKRQLRKIIKEAIDVTNASTGEVMIFADDDDPALGNFTPDAPELAAREIIKRLGLTPLEGYEDDPNDGVEEIYLGAEDWAEMDYEIGGKRHKRKAKKELARLDIDNLMTRLEDWAGNARKEYAADNPGTDMQDVAMDLARGAEYSFEPDEWNTILYTGPFEGEDDLYTYIADLIA